VVSLEQVIRECKQYNKLAQRILYDKYAPVMKGICLRYSGDADIANDILQEGFIKVFSQIRQYSGNGSFEGWMKRIFINTAISHLRKQKKSQKHIKLEDVEESTMIGIECIEKDEPHSNQNNFEIVSSADFSEGELLNVLGNIPEKYRTVFNLHCIENAKHEEIADILEIDLTTSRTRLLRARQLIQKELFEMSIARLSIKNKNA
jgi:RNA polymerase sigma-70 factor (ECF subfamily)